MKSLSTGERRGKGKEEKEEKKEEEEKRRERKREGCLSDSQTCTLLVNVLSFIDQKDDEKEFFHQIFDPFHNQLTIERKKGRNKER